MYEMFEGFWRACVNATDDEKDVANLKMMGDRYVGNPFTISYGRLTSISPLLPMPLLLILLPLHIFTALSDWVFRCTLYLPFLTPLRR